MRSGLIIDDEGGLDVWQTPPESRCEGEEMVNVRLERANKREALLLDAFNDEQYRSDTLNTHTINDKQTQRVFQKNAAFIGRTNVM